MSWIGRTAATMSLVIGAFGCFFSLPRVVGAEVRVYSDEFVMRDDTRVKPKIIEEPVDIEGDDDVSDGLSFGDWNDFLAYVCYQCKNRDSSLETVSERLGNEVYVRKVGGLRDSGLTLGMSRAIFKQASSIDALESDIMTDSLSSIVAYYQAIDGVEPDDCPVVAIDFEFSKDASSVAADVSYVSEACAPVVEHARGIPDPYERLEYLYSWACDALEYDDSYVVSDIAGALRSGRGVCASYAKLMSYLCRESGIECEYLTGDSYSQAAQTWEYHAWNRVYIDNRWLYIDSTWDDALNGRDYFLRDLDWFESHDHRLANTHV